MSCRYFFITFHTLVSSWRRSSRRYRPGAKPDRSNVYVVPCRSDLLTTMPVEVRRMHSMPFPPIPSTVTKLCVGLGYRRTSASVKPSVKNSDSDVKTSADSTVSPRDSVSSSSRDSVMMRSVRFPVASYANETTYDCPRRTAMKHRDNVKNTVRLSMM